jgi:hypothetical protein
MTPVESALLRDEAKYLHLSMFSQYPSNVISDAYVRAHTEIPELRLFDEQQLKTVQIVIAHNLDALGIEPWLRGKKSRHALGAKILLLAYLAECDASHPEFSRCASTARMAFINMGLAALKAGLSLLRGRIHKQWYGLV